MNSEEKKLEKLLLKLVLGSNTMRMMTSPYLYTAHKITHVKSGQQIMVGCSAYHGKCVVCNKDVSHKVTLGINLRRRWLIGVINRPTEQSKILDMPADIYEKMQTIVRQESWNRPNTYDVTIIRDGENGFSVVPQPKNVGLAMTSSWDKNIEFLIKKLCVPPSFVKVKNQLAMAEKGKGVCWNTRVCLV